MRISTFAALLALILVLGGCGGDEEGGASPPAAPDVAAVEPAAVEPAAEPAAAGQPPTPIPAAAPERPTGSSLEGSIRVEILDMQIFHAESQRRSLVDPTDLERRSNERGSGFAFGFVAAATNESPYLLATPRLLSDISIRGEHGVAPCRLVPRRSYWGAARSPLTVISPQRSERTPWADESRNPLESLWRPRETIRIRGVLECGPVHVHDIRPTQVSGSFQVVARAPFAPHEVECLREHEICDDDVVGTSTPVGVPGRVLSLSTAQIPNGARGYIAGDIFIYADEGRVRHETLSERGQSVFSVTTGDLPATPPPVRDTMDEWSMTISEVQLTHWTDAPTAPKGSRVVRVTATVSVDGAAIQARLRAELDAAQAADQAARSALTSAQAAVDASPEDPALQDALRAASTRSRDTASALSRAQSNYQRSLGSERSRLARLLACDRMDLVTHRRTLRPINGRDMATECRSLADDDSVAVSWVYVLSRYEVPVGVTYNVGREPHTAFFAAQPLVAFDPR